MSLEHLMLFYRLFEKFSSLNTFMVTFMYLYTYIYVHVYIYIYIYIFVCIYIYMIVYSQTIFHFSLVPLKNFFFELCMKRDFLRIKEVRRSKFLRTDQE